MSVSLSEFLLFLLLLIALIVMTTWVYLLRQEYRVLDEASKELARELELMALKAYRDPLTNLSNRTMLEEKAGLLFAFQHRKPALLSPVVLFSDLDGFKAVNDRYGHRAGDAVLVEFARRLRATFARESDIVARRSGDEFVVVLPDTSVEAATKLALDLLEKMRNEPIEFRDGEGNPGIAFIGASIGITAARTGEKTLSTALDRADVAMFRAKAAGKNGYTVLL